MKTLKVTRPTAIQAVTTLGIALICLLSGATASHATTYYVSTTGADTTGRDGLSTGAAWKSLAYACSRVPAGDHVIQIGAGTFNETMASNVPAGVDIKGSGADGANQTKLVAPTTTWDSSADGCTNNSSFYLIRLVDKNDCAVRDLYIQDNNRKSNGAIYSYSSDNLYIYNVVVNGFRFAGIHINQGNNVTIRNSRFYDTAYDSSCDASPLGQITTTYLTNSQIFSNYFSTGGEYGMGIRSRSNTNLKIYSNNFNIGSGDFDIEIAHGNEYGVQVYDNDLKRTISVPKTTGQPDPNPSGYPYSVRVHNNRSTSGYFVEGSRNYLEVDHNYVSTSTNRGQRFFQDFGNKTAGPVKIHHNVVDGADRSFIYFEDATLDQSGYLRGMQVFNNTVYFNADYGHSFANFYNAVAGRCTGWQIKNNIIVAPSTLTASWMTGATSTLSGLVATTNVTHYVTGVPSGNFNGAPGLTLTGLKPTPYYLPASGSSYAVNKGVDVGFPYSGSAPDAGAYEWTGTSATLQGSSTSTF